MKRYARPHVVPHRTRAERSIRAIGYLLSILIVLGTAGYLVTSGFSSRVPTSETVDLIASMNGFSQNEVRVKAGTMVTIRLTSTDNRFHSDGGGQHQWAVDQLGLNLIAPPEDSSSITFKANSPGVYTFYCDICCGGRDTPTMQGTLLVET